MAVDSYAGLLSPADLTSTKSSSSETRLISDLDELYEDGKRVRDRYCPPKDLEEDRKLYRGLIGPKSRDPYFKANFIEAFIDRMSAQLTDNRPVMRVEHKKAGLKNLAKTTQTVMRAIWDDCEMQRQLYKMCHTAAINRSAGLYTGNDPEHNDVALEMLRLSQVVCDPMVREAGLMKKAEYLFIDRVKPLSEVRRLFPGRGALVKADANISEDPEDSKRRSLLSPLTDILKGRNGSQDALGRAVLRECFIVDRQRDAAGRALFPNGRRIIKCKDYVLLDGPYSYWDGVWPIDWYDWIVDPDHPWGMSEPRRLKEMQLAFNQIMDGTVGNTLLTNIMSLIMDYDAVTPETLKKLQNLQDTLIIRKANRNGTVTLQPPPAFGADKIALSRAIFTFAQLLTGVTDVTLGETPGSLQSGQAIEGLQEGANLMTRSRASRLEDFMIRVGNKMTARMFQFWPSERVMHLVGPTGEALEYAFKRTEFFINDDGSVLTAEDRTEVFKYVRFKVQPGTSMPGSKIHRTELAMKLFVAGLETGQGVLETAEYPDAKERAAAAMAEAKQRSPEQQQRLQQMMGR